MNNKELWTSALSEIEINLSKANFSTWFKNTHIVKLDTGTVYLGVPNEFVRDWLLNKYHKPILKILRSLSDVVRGVEYIITKEDAPQKEKR